MRREALTTVGWLTLQIVVLLVAAVPMLASWPTPANLVSLVSDGSAEEAHTLPDDWRTRNHAAAEARYAFEFAVEKVPHEPWALLLTSVRRRTEVSVNGHPLDTDAFGTSAPNYRSELRPLFYPLPPEFLVVGSNQLLILLHAAPGRGYLSQPLLGPQAELVPLARLHWHWRGLSLLVIVITMSAIGAVMLVVWLQRRYEVVYGLYALGMLAWAGHDLEFVIGRPWLPDRYWDALSWSLLGTFIVATLFFILRFLGERRPRIERAVLVLASIGALLLWGLPVHLQQAFSDYLWHPAITAVGLYLYLHIWHAAWQRRSPSLHLLALSGSVMVLYGAHDLLIVLGLRSWDSGYLLPYAAAPQVIVFSALLVHRFVRSLTAVEALSRDLDRRVHEARAEIAANAIRMRDLERARWLAGERERVARDIHDGVGGQLVALLARIDNGTLSASQLGSGLSQALQDLRAVIESLDVAEGDLGTALATWRHLVERRLNGSHLRMVWKPADLPRLSGFGPSDILSVLRLLDEAANNALRHADASTLTVEYGVEAEQVFIFVHDNGRGGAVRSPAGHGIPNMRRRATDLGARLQLDSGEAGTLVGLWLSVAATDRTAVEPESSRLI